MGRYWLFSSFNVNFHIQSFLVKGQEDFMVVGRSVSTARLVGTLLCTWMGSGSLLAGAGLAELLLQVEWHQ